MTMRGSLMGAALLLAAGTAHAAAPDLKTCPRPESPDGGERSRTDPLPVPAALRDVVKASLYHYAVATLGGGTICVDTSWIETAEEIALSDDKRFFSFGWLGYESYGHKLVDRAGRGQVLETGVDVAFSPSRALLAAVDQTESEFGSLSGLAVWRAGPAGVTEVASLEDIPRAHRWRIDRWAGETCIQLSAIPFDKLPEDPADWDKAPRDRYAATAGKRGWSLGRPGSRCPA
jgi:hypothetical protein